MKRRIQSAFLAFCMLVTTIGSILPTNVFAADISAPVMTPGDGLRFNNTLTLTMSADAGDSIYYTTDGTEPSNASNKYTGAIEISDTCTIKAVAIGAAGMSEITEAKYTKDSTLVSPLVYDFTVINYVRRGGAAQTAVNISEASSYAKTDAFAAQISGGKTAPWCDGGKSASTGWLNQNAGNRINGKGEWGSFKIYVPENGIYDISGGIYYTNRADYQGDVAVYLSPVEASDRTDDTYKLKQMSTAGTKAATVQTELKKGVALAAGEYYYTQKSITAPYFWAGGITLKKVGSYTPPAKMVTSNLVSGEYIGTQEVMLSTATANAKIYYTTDGTDPDATDIEYTGAITIDEDITIKAIAIKEGFENSEIAEFKYVIVPPMPYAGEENSVIYDMQLAGTAEIGSDYTEYNETGLNSNWKYLSNKGGVPRAYYGGVRFASSNTQNPWVAFKIRVGAAGRYMAKMKYKTHYGANSADIHILPGDTQDIDVALADATPVGSVTYIQDAALSTLQNIKLGEVQFDTAGEYILVVRTKEAGTLTGGAGKGGTTFSLFELDGTEPSPLDSISLYISNTAISPKAPAQASVTGKLANGKTADLSPANLTVISYSSSDNNIVSIDSAGVITAVKPGKATITVTVTLDGVTLKASREVASLEYGGADTSFELDLMNGLAKEGENVGTLTEYNPEKNANWAYYGNYMDEPVLAKTKNGSVVFQASEAGAWSAIKFVSGKAGLYQLSMEYMNHAGAKKASAYLISNDADNISSVINNTKPLTTVAMKMDTDTQTAYFGEVALNENTEYILVLKAAQAGDDASVGKGTITANKIIFNGEEFEPPVPEIDTVTISAPENMPVGATTTAIISGMLVSGEAADMLAVDCKFTSSDDSVIEVNEITGEITAIASGKATITLTATYGGATATASCTINVVKRDTELSRTGEYVVYDFTSGLAKAYEQLSTLTTYNPTKNKNWVYGGYYTGATNSMQTYYGTVRISAKELGAWAAIKIKAPSNGIYEASLTWSSNAGAKRANVYLLSGTTNDIAAALETATPIGEIDYWVDGDPAVVDGTRTVELSELEINGEAEYFLVLQCSETCAQNTAAGIATMHISSFTLDSGLPLQTIEASLIGGATEFSMNVGTNAQIKVTTPQNPAEADEATITYKSNTPDIVTVSETGEVTAIANGIGEIEVTATLGEYSNTTSIYIVVGTVKNRRSYYTDEKVANARENIEKYAWAETIMENSVKEADKYVDKAEYLWNSVTTQNLPRSYWTALRNDPEYRLCPYCKVDIWTKFGNNSFLFDALNDPWKIQCPDCRRKFPSNDFGSYYALGIDEYGNWQPELSKQKNDELVANGEDGYLKNLLYPEMGEGWGVDNGYGWVTGRTFDVNGVEVIENKCFIPWYNEMALWYGSPSLLIGAANNLRNAYIYTGDIKYGRVGAILTDRMADVYPDFELKPFSEYFNADGGNIGMGKLLGKIPDYNLGEYLTMNYDGLWSAMDDPYVIDFLSKKAAQYNMENPKTSAELIRLNCDNGLLREINKAIRNGKINSNFGHQQRVMAIAAVTLDTMPETGEWIDWIFANGPDPSAGNNYVNVAGDVSGKLMDSVDRDGQGNEAAPAYNVGWVTSLLGVADALAGYDKYEAADLYKHPKMQKMITSQTDFIIANRYTPLIGDSYTFAKPTLPSITTGLVRSWYNGIKTDNIARMLYMMNNGDVSNIHGEIFVKDPEDIQEEIQAVVDSGVAMNVGSKNLTGYGLAVLRDGEWIDGNYGIDTQRAYWMYYGANSGHGHYDKLNLGIYAYGLNFAPDNGTPEIKTVDAKRYIWVESPLAHNTVTVIDHSGDNYSTKTQKETMISTPLHFDDSGIVKVMDADATDSQYQADIFRRTVVTVNATPEVDYAVDFFRVRGGEDHIYSFHALSNEVTVEGADLVEQNGGTYAGADVPWGADPAWSTKSTTTLKYPQGFTYLDNVHRAANPTASTISVDFAIDDNWNVLPNADDMHLKLTMLNDAEISEFAVVDAEPPQYTGVPKRIKQILARRTGEDLDSLYTAVIQPYKGEAYIESVEEVDVAIADGIPSKDDAVRAVKVTLKSGRIDYIVYATNKHVVYKVDDLFEFSGIVGVYSVMKDDEGNLYPVYRYVNDGTKIAGIETISEYTGTVEDFTTALSNNNEIVVSLDQNVDLSTLAGKYIYVNNDGVQNASYLIEKAYKNDAGETVINVGDVTLIRKHIEPYNVDAGYVYNIDKGQTFTIPLATLENLAPVFEPIEKLNVEASSEIKFNVKAESPNGNSITYKAISIPRGAQLDSETGAFTWVPDSARLGKNTVVVEAFDGITTSYITIEIEVRNATGGTSSAVSNPSMGTGGGGTGGATGGDTEKPDTSKDDENNPSQGGDATGKKFVDLGAHSWAEDAIYRLVEKNVINGTSENTYSPGANITRADFTTLIVRAFDFDADTAENFPDVASGKYYSDTIAIAKALGIVNGGSDGKFNPTSSISRQDMMVIIARAAEVAGIELAGDITNDFSDKDEVAAYAVDAVGQLISSGIIAGANGKINPNGTATRAEVAVILDRILS